MVKARLKIRLKNTVKRHLSFVYPERGEFRQNITRNDNGKYHH